MFKKNTTKYAIYEDHELGEQDQLTGKKYLSFEIEGDTIGIAPEKVEAFTEQLGQLLQKFLDDNTV